MKQKKNGIDLSDIGTKQLHSKHDVRVEKMDSGLVRATVKDQLVIDVYLFDDIITVNQHAEAERLLDLAQKAGVFLRSVDMGSIVSGGGRSDLAGSGFVRWRYAMNDIRRRHGSEGMEVVQDCIVENKFLKADRLDLLIQILSSE
jgi:hypothetical protein